MYAYGIVGNCQVSALVSEKGSLDWLCLPRPDSAPVFGKLLDPEGGCFVVEPEGEYTSEQTYLRHTNILKTVYKTKDGAEFSVTDFCPRFNQFGRIFRPIHFIRIVEPMNGEARVRVTCSPVQGWNKKPSKASRGNAHLRWHSNDDILRLSTDMSITHLIEQSSFSLNKKIYFVLTWNSSLDSDLPRLAEDYLGETQKYWLTWVKHCSIPTLFQEETIRSALALKLHCYEDTGAILAGITTSLPEEVGGVRNWDYRFCWLRDAYFVLSSLKLLGQFEEMEGFLRFLLNVVAEGDVMRDGLAPLYSLDHQKPGAELTLDNWNGFRGSKPVRICNQASEHVQNDVYGEMVLALAPIFFDTRFRHLRSSDCEHLLELLVKQCSMRISQADAGPWEIRTEWREHSFSNLLCWAGLERARRIQKMGYLRDLPFDLSVELERAETALNGAVRGGTLRNGAKDESVDASLLLMPIFRYPDNEICKATVEKIFADLQVPGSPPGYLYRYIRKDDFGKPQSAFLICGFWLVQALAKVGGIEQATAVLRGLMKSANCLGLYSEHYDPLLNSQSGNFPQAYSHVGQINAAFAVSPIWSDIL